MASTLETAQMLHASCARATAVHFYLTLKNGPERIDFKKKLYAQLDELLPASLQELERAWWRKTVADGIGPYRGAA